MSRSGEKHAQDYNLMWCILMALRVIYFQAVIYGDPVPGVVPAGLLGHGVRVSVPGVAAPATPPAPAAPPTEWAAAARALAALVACAALLLRALPVPVPGRHVELLQAALHAQPVAAAAIHDDRGPQLNLNCYQDPTAWWATAASVSRVPRAAARTGPGCVTCCSSPWAGGATSATCPQSQAHTALPTQPPPARPSWLLTGGCVLRHNHPPHWTHDCTAGSDPAKLI